MPLIVTTVPGKPLAGEKLVIVGSGTVKLLPEQPVSPATVTHIGPVAAPLGTMTDS